MAKRHPVHDLDAAHPTCGRAVKLPPQLRTLLEQSPPYVDRRAGADLVTRHLFPVSHRSLEIWRVPTRRVNGKAIMSTTMLFEEEWRRFSVAPKVMSGDHRNTTA